MKSFQEQVYSATKQIPKGRVATYAGIAYAIGRPGAARAVGNALNKNPYRDVPCHRVVRADRHVGGFARGAQVKIILLRQEGVLVTNKHVDTACLFYF